MSQPTFGAPGLFGAQPALSSQQSTMTPAFGQQNPQGAQGGLFGQPQQTGGLFGAQTQQQPAQGGLFGAQPAQQPAPGGLFGAQQPAQGGLFGAQPASQPAQGGLFGAQPAKTGLFGAQPAQGLFGATSQPAQGSLFGGQQQQPTGGLFGQPPQGGLFGNMGANQPAQASGMAGTPAMFGQPQANAQPQQNYISLIEAQSRAYPLQVLCAETLQVNLNNCYRRRTLHSFPDQQNTLKEAAYEIETKYNAQTSQISDLQKTLAELTAGTSDLTANIIKACIEVQQYNTDQVSLRQNISMLEHQLQQLHYSSQDLQKVLHDFDNGKTVAAPFKFYQQMQQQQEQIIEKLAAKVDQASQLCRQILTSPDTQQHQSLKDRIFTVCQMLYEQQKKAAASLFQIEKQVFNAKQQFTHKMMQTNPYLSESDIEQLFKNKGNHQVNLILADIQKSKQDTQLSKIFSDSLKIEAKEVAKPQKTKLLTSRSVQPESYRKRDIKYVERSPFSTAVSSSRQPTTNSRAIYQTPHFADSHRSYNSLTKSSVNKNPLYN